MISWSIVSKVAKRNSSSSITHFFLSMYSWPYVISDSGKGDLCTFSHSLVVFPLWDVYRDQPIPHSSVGLLHVYMLYACCICVQQVSGECYWLSVGGSYGRLLCRQLYTYLRGGKCWTIVWENTNGVYFRAVWKNTAHFQGIRCSPKGSHLIPWTSAVFSYAALKWTPFAYRDVFGRQTVMALKWSFKGNLSPLI